MVHKPLACNDHMQVHLSVADPGFPVGGGPRPRRGGTLTSEAVMISKILYVKTKESGPLGRGVRRARS